MNRRALILLPVLLLCGVFYLLRPVPETQQQADSKQPAEQSQHGASTLQVLTVATEESAYAEQTRAQTEKLAKVEAEKRIEEEFETRVYEARSQLQFAYTVGWSNVVMTNWQAALELRQRAAASPSQKSACTLCDGHGSLDFCVLCGQSGKCVLCKGSGHTHYNEPCPACRGKGKCYLCMGSGRMACAFCDDGIIYLNLPLPSALLPLRVAAVSRPPAEQAIAQAWQPPAASVIRGTPPAPSEPVRRIPAVQPQTASTESPPLMSPDAWSGQSAITATLLLAGALIVRRVVPRIAEFLNAQSNPWEPVYAGMSSGMAAQQAISESATYVLSRSSSAPAISSPEATKTTVSARFFEAGPECVAAIRRGFSAAAGALDVTARGTILEDTSDQIRSLRVICDSSGLQLVYQLLTGLEGLLKQISHEPLDVAPSALRTAAGAIVALEALCKLDPSHDFAVNFVPRFLVVDDDPVSRHAVSSALKKFLGQPDLATDGQAALKLAAEKRYDVIFLDVEMPGLDGFAVCTKIRQSELNHATPVVFVTGHSDFASRAKSAEVGGHDLVGKPFLPFEITVKALTLVIRNRLLGSQRPCANDGADRDAKAADQHKDGRKVSKRAATVVFGYPPKDHSPTPTSPANASASPQLPADAPESASGGSFAERLMTQAPADLFRLRNQLMAANKSTETADIVAILEEFYVGVNSLTRDAERAELRALFQLSWGTEKLIKKLLENPSLRAGSVFSTTTAALDMMEELCRNRTRLDPRNPPIRILVVDDDPIARRAMFGTLQLGFARPNGAQSGDEAVKLASKDPYDVIFLDVLMIGMDGFSVCSRIRKTGLNAATPVIFLTSLSDDLSREQSDQCGGNGFIVKPLLAAEIALITWTCSLRARLQSLEGCGLQGQPHCLSDKAKV